MDIPYRCVTNPLDPGPLPFNLDFDHSKLDLKNKLLMDLLRIRLLMKRKRTPEEVGMLAAFKHPLDAARKENLKDLLGYVKAIG